MRSLAGALALLLALAAPAAASERVPLDTSRPPELLFNGQSFGAPPAPGMVCVHGHCRNELDPGVRPVLLPYSSYELPGGPASFAGFAIEPPRYTYWEGRLYRIYFRVLCDPEQVEASLETLAAELDARYGLTPIEPLVKEDRRRRSESHSRRYVTRSGALVTLNFYREGSVTELPRIELIDHGTHQRVALASNPRYRVKTLLVPADYASR